MSVKIFEVEKGSFADKKGIKSGDTLVSINGNDIEDVLDFRFHQQNERVILRVINSKGREKSIRIKKGEYDELGLNFETYLIDKQHSCKNKCVFCFVDQLPKGMRSSLYFKDDDTRLSFLFGNYVTLTNITEREIQRIIDMHISPINVSVHTTNPDLRVKMMANPNAARVMDILKRFAKANISLNCQLVLCPEINDGAELERSLNDLSTLAPAIKSIALVPVGLTRHREGLCPLKPYDKEKARKVISCANEYGERFLKEFGTRLVYPADEFYIKAGLPLPEYDFYEDFLQLENGVGLIRSMQNDIDFCLENEEENSAALDASIATGVDAAPFIEKEIERIKKVFPNLNAKVFAVKNDFFGHTITVAGLLTARDIINSLKGKHLGSHLILPDVMLRHQTDKFLDDLTIGDVEKELNVKVVVAKADGEGLFDAIANLLNDTKEG